MWWPTARGSPRRREGSQGPELARRKLTILPPDVIPGELESALQTDRREAAWRRCPCPAWISHSAKVLYTSQGAE